MSAGLNVPGWHGRIRRLGVSVVVVFALLFIYLRLTSTNGIDRFGNGLAPDLSQFYVAGEMAAHGEIQRIYDEPYFKARVNILFGLPEKSDSYPFRYPPFVPWLCVPLTWTPYPVAATLFIILSAVVVAALGWWVARYFLSDREEVIDATWLLVASIPAVRCVLYGQNGWLSLLVIWLGYWLWESRRDLACGFVMALGAYKPQLFIGVWVWLLLFGSSRARIGLILGCGGGFLLGCAGVWNGTLWLDWVRVLTHVYDSQAMLGQMHSWLNAFEWWQPLPNGLKAVRGITWFVLAMSWLAVLATLRQSRIGTKESRARWAFMLALWGWVWVTPRFCQYDALILYPVLVWSWGRIGQVRARARNWELVCIVCMVSSFYLVDFFVVLRIPWITILGVCIWIVMCIKALHRSDEVDADTEMIKRRDHS